MNALQGAYLQGKIPNPAMRPQPQVFPRAEMTGSNEDPCLTPEHVFAYEDTAGVLTSNYSIGELVNLMVDASNAPVATHGDLYNYISFWVNYTPHHFIGAAFYLPWMNDIQGIGLDIFDRRPAAGLAGNNIQGFVMMWDIRSGQWQAGIGGGSNFTRLVLAREFEHRHGMFLPDLLDGRRLQGNNGNCGREWHWNWAVDGQGSGMEIAEWVGSNRLGTAFRFNTDITGGVFSYTDLYLMGYVSPAEMDAGNSELRYMNGSSCGTSHGGLITSFDSSDIIASAGPRVPESATAQKHYRTGWIMLHLPATPPTSNQLNKAIAIEEQHMIDWRHSTLGLGTMNNSLFEDCNCNGVPDAQDIASGTSTDVDMDGIPDECSCTLSNYCTTNANSTGAEAVMSSSGSLSIPSGDFTLIAALCPSSVNGIFYYGPEQIEVPFGNGNRCVAGGILRLPMVTTDFFGGASYQFDLDGPPTGVIAPGSSWNFQFWVRDTAVGGSLFNLSDGLAVTFCP